MANPFSNGNNFQMCELSDKSKSSQATLPAESTTAKQPATVDGPPWYRRPPLGITHPCFYLGLVMGVLLFGLFILYLFNNIKYWFHRHH